MLPIVGMVVCDLFALELVQDCSFTSSIDTDHTKLHFLHSKKPTDQFGEIQPHFFKFQLNSESISQIPVHLTLSHKLSTLILNQVTRFHQNPNIPKKHIKNPCPTYNSPKDLKFHQNPNKHGNIKPSTKPKSY